jgi:hypothetical protein
MICFICRAYIAHDIVFLPEHAYIYVVITGCTACAMDYTTEDAIGNQLNCIHISSAYLTLSTQ